MIDMSIAPVGKHADLEAKYGYTDPNGNLWGAVFTGAEIDALRATAGAQLPIDEVGHGTHVAGIAAGNGGVSPNKTSIYKGFASEATLVVARISGPGSDTFDEGPMLSGVAFLFDRGDALGKPTVVNLSLGSEVGPHDGTATWEKALASHVVDDHGVYTPGHAIVVAAGNSGSISELPTHQSVYVAEGTKMRVPIATQNSNGTGGVQVWITMRAGASMKVGLEGPDGSTWVSPVGAGDEQGHNTSDFNSGVINGVDSDGNGGSSGGKNAQLGNTPYALVLWSGKWPTGTYQVTLDGSGTAELYVSGTGAAAAPGAVTFEGGVREGTVNLPATHPAIISVGCTINKPQWTSIGKETLGLGVPKVDTRGGLPVGGSRDAVAGEVCYFSSAGPTITGVPKPEIVAPGGIVVSSMSKQAAPGQNGSVFTVPCPPPRDGGAPDERCFQVDETHAVQAGTSMSAPMVAGTIALLFQRDPTLTQDKLTALLQGGAHALRVPSLFDDQTGPGELDVQGALDALDQMQNPRLVLPDASASWLTLGAEYVAADGSQPLAAIVELRTSGGTHRADLFDASRLHAWVTIDGAPQLAPALQRLGPGLWTTSVRAPTGLGGSSLTIGVTFDGANIVTPKTVPIGTDFANAQYPTHVKGGCAIGARAPTIYSGGVRDGGDPWWCAVAIGVVLASRRRGRAPQSDWI
jgi:subtilisin family serine protease